VSAVRAAGERDGLEIFVVELTVAGASVKLTMTGHELCAFVEDAAEALAARAAEGACAFCDEQGCLFEEALAGPLRELRKTHAEAKAAT
jgi:hypothetical protein